MYEPPETPLGPRGRRLVDAEGRNRFADQTTPTPAREDPFAPPAQLEGRPYRPGDYETFLPHRARLILTLALVGLGIELLGIVAGGAGLVTTQDWTGGLFFSLSAGLLGLACSIPGWLLGRSDWQAICAGAMDAQGKQGTRAGHLLSIAGTLIGCLLVLGLPAAAIIEAWLS